jgi:hypothetical protein
VVVTPDIIEEVACEFRLDVFPAAEEEKEVTA